MLRNPVPVMVRSSPPLVQPEVADRLAWRGLVGAMGSVPSSDVDEWNTGVRATATSTAATNHVLIGLPLNTLPQISFRHTGDTSSQARTGATPWLAEISLPFARGLR